MSKEVRVIAPSMVNCYLVKLDDGFILVDTGGKTVFDMDFKTFRDAVEKELENAGYTPGKMKLIVITHGDGDHTGNASFFRDKYKAKIAMHPADNYIVENGKLSNARVKSFVFGIISSLMGFSSSKLKATLENYEKFTPDIALSEGFDLSPYGWNAKVIHLPGHTEGSVGIISEDGDLFCGDILAYYGKGKPVLSFLGVDFNEMKKSLEKIKKLDVKTVYPGHGKPFSGELLKQL